MASTSSPSVAPIGSQRPRICHVPEYVSSSGDEAIELARLAGLEADDWQDFVVVNALGEQATGKWAAPSVGLAVARQNGKGSVLEIRELAGLFLFGERLINHTAHQQKTATNHFNRMLQLIEGVPEFDRRVLRAPRGKGQEAIELRGGQVIFFATRAGGGGRGLTADLQVYDEAMYLSEQDRASLTPTMAALSMHGNVQTWYVGSAVDEEDPAQDGVPFAQIREAGIRGARDVAYFEFSAPGDDPSQVPTVIAADPAMWAMANPGLGIRISHEWVEHERTAALGPRSFAVERLGIGAWPDTSGDAGRVIGIEAWVAAAEHDPLNRVTSRPTFAIDASPDHSWASLAVAGGRDDGLDQFAIIDHERGVDWLVERCVYYQVRNKKSVFVLEAKGPAASLVDDLEAAGVKVLKASGEDYGNGCGQFVDAVTGGRAKYPHPQPELDNAVSSARPSTSDLWKWARRTSTSADITPIVAATLALWGHLRKPPRARVINPYDFV
jgi:phage terminase large subunit-like protein